LSDKKNTYTIVYTPNLEWLKSEERVYPVIVDPVITISDKSNIIDTFTSSKFGSAIIPKHGLDYAYVQNDGTLCQTFVALDNDDVEALPANVQILSAKLSMVAKNKSGNNNIINAHKITESWNNLTLINSNKPSYDSTPLSFATITGTSSGRYTWDITEAFAEWLYDESLSNGVMLHTPSSGQVLLDTKEISDESKRPYFIVEYRESTGVIDDFSYRVQDLGRSGTVYINENTRSFYLEREGNLGNEYDWRVELWMGRYGISLGAEIGIYKGHQFLDYELPIDFWYACSTEDRYPMAFILCRTEKSSDGTTFAKPFLMRITKSHWAFFGHELILVKQMTNGLTPYITIHILGLIPFSYHLLAHIV